MGALDAKPDQANALKTKSTKVHKKKSPLDSAKKLLTTTVNDTVGKQKNGEDQIPSKGQDSEGNPKSQILSDKSKCEDQIPLTASKEKQKRRRFQKLYAEVCSFDSIDKIALFYKRSFKVGKAIGINASHMCPVNCVFDTGT